MPFYLRKEDGGGEIKNYLGGYRLKVILGFLFFSVLVCSILSISAYRVLYRNIFSEIRDRTRNIAQLGAYYIDTSALKRLMGRMSPGLSEDEKSALEQSTDFKLISDQLNAIRNIESSLVRYAYIIRPSKNGTGSHYVADADTISDLINISELKKEGKAVNRFNGDFDASLYPVFLEAVKGKKCLVEKEFVYDTVFKVYSISAYAPIIDKDTNAVLAVLGVDVIDRNVQNAIKESRRLSLIVSAFALTLSLIISIVLGNIFAKGIVSLDRVVKRYGEKDFAARASVKSRDEIGRLALSLNYMAETIQNYASRLETLLAAYSRFVPRNFLHFLNKESITDVRLGDQTQQEMTILFSDIRSFTTLSESMTPKENFNFINSYLRRVGPVIRLRDGFIDKYIGDAIMALFPGDPDDAVMAAIDMLEAVAEYNSNRISVGYKPISIGVGIHTGFLMLGTIGEEERMDSTVISDAVNLCSRIEDLTKRYVASIIISEETLHRLKRREKYKMRFLDKVQVKGKSTVVSIYEVYDADPPEVLMRKDMSKEALERGIRLFFDGRFQDTLDVLMPLRENFPEDILPELYIGRCRRHLRDDISECKDAAFDDQFFHKD
jgi:class 3 adenylate cyclase